MIATEQQYHTARELVREFLATGLTVTPERCASAGVEYDGVLSLYNQMSVRHLKRETKRGIDAVLLSSFEAASDLCSVLGELSAKYQVGGYKLARIYLELKFGKGSVSIAQFLENPLIVEDERFREELLVLMSKDPFCSHPCDQLKECIGKEYEEYLIARLQEKRLCFETEAELRSRGKPKTPDILFLIPMAAYICSNDPSCDGALVVVNWIDSKAMFADEETLAEHFEQLRGYTNRYGRGLVIYWHGYVESLTSSDLFLSFNDMVVLSSDLPDEWHSPGALDTLF